MKPIKHDNPQAIPAKRYFSIDEACAVLDIDRAQLMEWQRQEGMLLGKGANTLTRLDVLKLRQLRHSIGDYFARGSLDAQGNPVIGAEEMREHLTGLLGDIEKTLAN